MARKLNPGLQQQIEQHLGPKPMIPAEYRKLFKAISATYDETEAVLPPLTRYRTLFTSFNYGVIVYDMNGSIVQANEAAARLLAYPMEELLIQGEGVIAAAAAVAGELRSNAGGEVDAAREFESQFRKRNGSMLPVQLSLKCFEIEAVPHILAVFRDITLQKDAEDKVSQYQEKLQKLVNDRTVELIRSNQELHREIRERIETEKLLREAKDAAETANRAKSQFLANVSHEFRTPMNAILGFSSLLESMLSGAKEVQYLRAIRTSGKGLLELLNDILDLSKIEAGMLKIEAVPVDLKQLFADIELVYEHRAAEKGLAFNLSVDKGVPRSLVVDEVRLRQILVNMLGNAIKFTENGSVGISVRTAQQPDNRERFTLTIAVTDTGIGIPAEQHEQIFQAFVQQSGQNSRMYSGTGLGLAISKQLAWQMSGDLFLKSVPGEGSTFSLVLRDVHRGPSPANEERDISPHAARMRVFEPARLLLIEDNELNAQLVREYLHDTNIEVLHAENGKIGTEKAATERPQIIIMDVQMPEMDGFQAATILKQDGDLAQIPVIVLTANAFEDVQKRFALLNCNEFLTKPVTREHLLSTLAKYLPSNLVDLPANPVPEASSQVKDSGFEEAPEAFQEIVADLRSIYVNRVHMLERLLLVDEAEAFGAEMRELGSMYRIKQLCEWGQHVQSAADSFNVEELRTLLRKFDGMVNSLENIGRATGRKR